MEPLFHSYRLNGIPRTELFSLPPLRAEKRGGGGGCEVALLGTLRSSFELKEQFFQPGQRLRAYL